MAERLGAVSRPDLRRDFQFRPEEGVLVFAVDEELVGDWLAVAQVGFLEHHGVGRDELVQPVQDRPRHGRAGIVADAVLDDRGQGAQVPFPEQP